MPKKGRKEGRKHAVSFRYAKLDAAAKINVLPTQIGETITFDSFRISYT